MKMKINRIVNSNNRLVNNSNSNRMNMKNKSMTMILIILKKMFNHN